MTEADIAPVPNRMPIENADVTNRKVVVAPTKKPEAAVSGNDANGHQATIDEVASNRSISRLNLSSNLSDGGKTDAGTTPSGKSKKKKKSVSAAGL